MADVERGPDGIYRQGNSSKAELTVKKQPAVSGLEKMIRQSEKKKKKK